MFKQILIIIISYISLSLNGMDKQQKNNAESPLKPDLLEPTSLLPEIKNIINDYYTEWDVWEKITNNSFRYYALAFSKDNKVLAYTSDNNKITIYNLEQNKPCAEFNCRVRSNGQKLFFSDDSLIISHPKKISILNLITKKIKNPTTSFDCSHISVSANGNFLAYNYDDSNVNIYKLDSDLITKISTNFKSVCQNPLVLSPNGKLLAVRGWTGIKIWDIESNKILYNYDTCVENFINGLNDVNTFDFSYNNKLFAFLDNGTIKILDLDTKNLTDFKENTSVTSSLVFSPKEMLLASSHHHSCEIKLWNPISGKLIQAIELKNSIYNARSLKFSYDGKLLAYIIIPDIFILKQKSLR